MLWHMMIVHKMLSRTVWLSSGPFIGSQARPRGDVHELTEEEASLIDKNEYSSNSALRSKHLMTVVCGPFANMERFISV